jgi:hypothetical protein
MALTIVVLHAQRIMSKTPGLAIGAATILGSPQATFTRIIDLSHSY